MNGFNKIMAVLVLLIGNVFIFSSSGATIPIVSGNTWIYQHHSLWDAFAPGPGQKDGLFIMSIDSVSVRGDSVLFKMTAIDSGTGWNWMSYYTYDNRDTNNYLLTNNTLFAMDTGTGLWNKYTGSLLSYLIQPDSAYHFEGTTSPYDTIAYQRHTDSATVIINGRDTGEFYASIRDSLYIERWIIPPPMGYSITINDTTQWLENIGSIYQVHTMLYLSYGIFDVNTSTLERYSLISFNGSPVTITPLNPGVRSTALSARQIISPRYRKITLFGEQPLNTIGSTRYINLLGRNIGRLQRSQVLIYKK